MQRCRILNVLLYRSLYSQISAVFGNFKGMNNIERSIIKKLQNYTMYLFKQKKGSLWIYISVDMTMTTLFFLNNILFSMIFVSLISLLNRTWNQYTLHKRTMVNDMIYNRIEARMKTNLKWCNIRICRKN